MLGDDYQAMTCEQYCELISARMDGETSADQNEAVQQHLATCLLCANFADRVERLSSRLRVVPVQPIDVALLNQVVGDVTAVAAARAKRRRAVKAVARPLASAAALAIVAGGLSFVLSQDSSPAPMFAAAPSIEIRRSSASPTELNGTSVVSLELANLTNDDDALVAVESPLARVSHLHITRSSDMRTTDEIQLGGNQTKHLERESGHVMLMDTTQPLVTGDEVPVTLYFLKSQPITVMVPIEVC
jgi:copper(I)-binding protein